MHWFKGAASATEDFGSGRAGPVSDEDSSEVPSRRSSVASSHVQVPRRISVGKPINLPPPTPPSSALGLSDDGIKDWVTQCLTDMNDVIKAELVKFQQRIETHEQSTRRTLVELSKKNENNSLMIERASRAADQARKTVEEMEEKTKSLMTIEPRFLTFRQEVQEALQYLDEERYNKLASQCNRLERVIKKSVCRICADYRDLDNRMTVQALAASTFSLKAISMDNEQRTKSLKFLASEESRVKEHLTRNNQISPSSGGNGQPPEPRASDEELYNSLEELPPKETREKTLKILNNGPSGVGQLEGSASLGLLDVLTSEAFCLDVMSLKDSERKCCSSVLKKHMSQLRSAGVMKDVLEGIHAEAMQAVESGDEVRVTL